MCVNRSPLWTHVKISTRWYHMPNISNHHLVLKSVTHPLSPMKNLKVSGASISITMVTNMQADEWLTCLAQPLTLWIINLPLCLTCWYRRQRLSSPQQVVTTPFSRNVEIKLSGSHTVSIVLAFVWSCFLWSFFLSFRKLTLLKEMLAGCGAGTCQVSEWGAALIASSCSPSGTAPFSIANVIWHTHHWALAIASFITACI